MNPAEQPKLDKQSLMDLFDRKFGLGIADGGPWADRLKELRSVMENLVKDSIELDPSQYESVQKQIVACVGNPEQIEGLITFINSFSKE